MLDKLFKINPSRYRYLSFFILFYASFAFLAGVIPFDENVNERFTITDYKPINLLLTAIGTYLALTLAYSSYTYTFKDKMSLCADPISVLLVNE